MHHLVVYMDSLVPPLEILGTLSGAFCPPGRLITLWQEEEFTVTFFFRSFF